MLCDQYLWQALMRHKIDTWLREAARDRRVHIALARRSTPAAAALTTADATGAAAGRRPSLMRLGAHLASSLRLW